MSAIFGLLIPASEHWEIAVRIAPTVSKFLMGTAYALEYVESLIRTWSFDQAGKDATKAAKEIYDAMQAAGVAAQKTTQATQAHTSAVQSNAAGNLDMAVVHEERHKDILRNMRELKREVTTSDKLISVVLTRVDD